MKKTILTDSEKRLLLIVLSLGLLVCAWFFGYTKMVDEAKTIKASNQQDQALVTQLEGMVARQAATQQETQKFKDSIKEVIAKYPVALPQEKMIYRIQEMQDVTGIEFSSLSFAMNNVLFTFTQEEVNPIGYYSTVSLPYSASYETLKTVLDYAKEYEDRMTIPTITAAYDQATGQLSGAISFKMFFLTNTDKEYEEIPETGIESGLPDIFRTVVVEVQ